MHFTAFLCLIAVLAASAAGFPIKTRDEQRSDAGNVQKTTLYGMIFGQNRVQKPSNKASGHPVHVHEGMQAVHHKKPARNRVHVHRREQLPDVKK